MADDERNGPSPRATVRNLDSDELEELEELQELPQFPDREEFVQTLEMDSATRDDMTRPMRKLPDATTQNWDVPEQLLEMAARSQDIEVVQDDWREFVAVVDKKGRISLPSSVHQAVRGKKIVVRFKLQDDS